MTMKILKLALLSGACLLTIDVSSVYAQTSTKTEIGNPAEATYEGRTIDLSVDWSGATACVELGTHTDCYRTMDDLQRAVGGNAPGSAAMTSCTASVSLYRSTNYGGGTLILTSRLVVINLSAYGFDNDTSSYKIGGCSATFYSNASLGGAVYPGPTGAGSSATSMLSTWDNVVSSVYIA